jgi:transposase
MSLVALNPHDRSLLEYLADHAEEAAELRRALALLWLDDGDDVREVADRLRVSRQTVYNWAQRLHDRPDASLPERLADGARSGRPPTAQGVIDPLLAAVLDGDPRDWGYHATVWTAPLLRQFLRDEHGLVVSIQSVRLAVARLDVLWKRPRHRLANRPETWRQSKGGSSVACATACAPSC